MDRYIPSYLAMSSAELMATFKLLLLDTLSQIPWPMNLDVSTGASFARIISLRVRLFPPPPHPQRTRREATSHESRFKKAEIAA